MKTSPSLKILAFLGWLLVGGTGCADILVPDLSEKSVVLKAPTNGLESSQASQTFWWEQLDLAPNGYRLEIVSPSFDSVAQLILQTEVTEEETFTTTLSPGTYQWTVVGFNEAGTTTPAIYDLVILNDSSSNLTNQMLNLVSPVADLATNNTAVTFLWQELPDATDYKIQVASPDFTNSTFFAVDATISADNYTATLPEGTYRWRVRAENETTITPYSERSLTIDLTAPVAPTLLSPIDSDTLQLPAMLAWDVDATSALDTLYLYTDANLTSLVLKEATTATSFQLDGVATDQKYYWRLRSVDAAGNTGSFSSVNCFFIE